MPLSDDQRRFEQLVLPHLDGAYNFACWLLRNRTDGEDVVQEAVLRAFRYFDRFQGDDARAWLLQIVRNTCYSWLQKNRQLELMTEFDEELHYAPGPSPESLAAHNQERHRLLRVLQSLSARAREIIVLRELEGCSYKQIAEITGAPMGTIMSTLSRIRERLQHKPATHTARKHA
ncbi:MAG: sigma-70 family RNA polymerase sigma factor [Acidobacteria bacterium]|nr:sigma-70 family RNA polymerase sigma factor [Acidobacteriota bacterium]MBV8890898.1 sigma-70 family RNA polymerase sigma factor [Acidobacteriota bacterium]MBV9479284.1 sigma-70 family RNA polymerase sigma factor [Acidobacteriota bacterium]